MRFRRYAVYHTPPVGAFAEFGAGWLGWDIARGKRRDHPEIAGLPRPVEELTETPRRYGFHGTLKPPFRLAGEAVADDLAVALEELANGLAPVELSGLRLDRLGGFLALTPEGDAAPVEALAARVVKEFDRFRAPASEAELARRRSAGLSAPQEALMAAWGYPYVLDEFRFHITLTGQLPSAVLTAVEAALRPALAVLIPAPYPVRDLTLVGEDAEGRFHAIDRYALSG